jgi:hypothetical protein
MSSKKPFNSATQPLPMPDLMQWERLTHELLDDPAAKVLLDAGDLAYANARIRAMVETEMLIRIQFMEKCTELMKQVDLDTIKEATINMLNGLLGKSASPGKIDTEKLQRCQTVMHEFMKVLTDEKQRRVEYDEAIGQAVKDEHDLWVKNGMPTETAVQVGKPLRLQKNPLTGPANDKIKTRQAKPGS